MKLSQTESKRNHEKIHVVIFAKDIIDLDNGSGHLVGDEEADLKII